MGTTANTASQKGQGRTTRRPFFDTISSPPRSRGRAAVTFSVQGSDPLGGTSSCAS